MSEQALLQEVRRLRSIVRDYERDDRRIVVEKERLSDGSFVFNVRMPPMLIAAEDEGAAQRFADAVAALCNEHNTHYDVEVRFAY